MAESYRVVSPQGAVVRKDFHMTSPQAGQLRRGEVIVVLEEKSDITRVVRVRFELKRKYGEGTVAGWVPLTGAGGKAQLEKVGAPAPAPPGRARAPPRSPWGIPPPLSPG